MSYQIENIREIYSNIKDPKSEFAEEIVNTVVIQLINEGYSDEAITCYLNTEDEVAIIEKYISIPEGIVLKEEYLEERIGRLIQGAGKVIGKVAKFASKQGIKDRKTLTTGAKNLVNKITGKSKDALKTVSGNQTSKMNAIKDNIRSRNGMPPIDRNTSGVLSTIKNKSKDLATNVSKTSGKIKDKVVSGAKNLGNKAQNMSLTNKRIAVGTGIVGGTIVNNAMKDGNKQYKDLKNKVDKETAELDKLEKNTTGGQGNKGRTPPKLRRDEVITKAPSKNLSFGDAIKAANTDAGKDLVKSVTSSSSSPKKPSTASGKELPKAKAVKKGSAKANMIARNKETFGSDKIDKLRSKNAAFQAAKKSGSNYSMDDFVKDFPNSNAAKDRKKSKTIQKVDPNNESVQHSGETVDEALGLGFIKGGIRKAVTAVKDKVAQSKGQPTSKEKAVAKADTTSPAAKGGMSADLRARAAAKHAKFKRDRAAGKLKSKNTTIQKVDPNMESVQHSGETVDEALGLSIIKGGIRKTVSTIKDKVAQSKGQPTSKEKAVAKADTTSPAAKSGMSSDMRAQAAARHAKFKRDRAAGKLKSRNTTVQKVDPNMESYDAYDIVLDYLLETNQVDTIEEANYVMLEMDSKTIQDIVNNK
jgi:hypothetical protein